MGVVRRQHKIVSAFREAGATSRDRAITVASLGLHEGLAFRILCSHEVLRESAGQSYYLDESSWEALRARRRKIAFMVVGVFVLITAYMIFWVGGR